MDEQPKRIAERVELLESELKDLHQKIKDLEVRTVELERLVKLINYSDKVKKTSLDELLPELEKNLSIKIESKRREEHL